MAFVFLIDSKLGFIVDYILFFLRRCFFTGTGQKYILDDRIVDLLVKSFLI